MSLSTSSSFAMSVSTAVSSHMLISAVMAYLLVAYWLVVGGCNYDAISEQFCEDEVPLLVRNHLAALRR